MAGTSDWIQPGVAATMIWYDAVAQTPQGQIYQVAGPALEAPPESPYFLLAPVERGDFATRLYASEVSLLELREFLAGCRVAEGGLDTECEVVVARREASLLPLLEDWAREPSGEPQPFRADINAFLVDEVALCVTPEAHAAVQREPARFATSWVCEESGAAEDQAVFLWTAHAPRGIQVWLAIQNTGGVWTCWLHPFQIQKEPQ